MTTKFLTGQLASAYELRAPVTELIVRPGASVAGNANYGIYTSTAATVGYVVINEGTVKSGGPGILLNDGGTVTNGQPNDTTALIDGVGVIVINGAPGVVKNFATIGTGSVAHSSGVRLTDGGTVTNGSAADTTALILASSGHAIYLGLPGAVVNFGTVTATATNQSLGVVTFEDGGRLTNEATGAIVGRVGVASYNYHASQAAVTNLGTIDATKVGAHFTGGAGGVVTNGSSTNRTALVEGANGVVISGGTGTVTNFATIEGQSVAGVYGPTESRSGTGVYFATGGVIENFGDAVIGGNFGVDLTSTDTAGTVINFGTIESTGTAGYAVRFAVAATGPGSSLIVEKGSDFIGNVNGGGGTLELASGVGTISALAFGDVTVSGEIPVQSFDNFHVLEIGKGSRFTLSSTGTVGSGSVQSLVIDGQLQVTGTLVVSGSVSGSGILAVNGGLATLSPATAIDVELFNHGDLTLGDSKAYGGTIRGLSKTAGNHLDLLDIGFGGSTKASYSGTVASGTLTVTDGIHTAKIALEGDYLGTTWRLSTDGQGGVIVADAPAAKPSAPAIVSAMAGFAPATASANALADWRLATVHAILVASHTT